MASRLTWTDTEVALLLHAECVVTLYRAGEPSVTEGRITSASGARVLVDELDRARSCFYLAEGTIRRDARRVLKAVLRDFQRAERDDEWLRRQLEGLGKEGA